MRTVRAAGLQGDEWNAALDGALGHLGEALGVAHCFEEQADRGDPLVVEEGRDGVVAAEAGLVADGDHRAEAQAALLEREVHRDIAALADDRHAALVGAAPVLVGPQGHLVEGVDEAVAVGAEEGHVARGREQVVLEVIVAGLGEAAAVADRPARADRAHCGHGLDRGVAVHAEEHRVGHAGQVGQ